MKTLKKLCKRYNSWVLPTRAQITLGVIAILLALILFKLGPSKSVQEEVLSDGKESLSKNEEILNNQARMILESSGTREELALLNKWVNNTKGALLVKLEDRFELGYCLFWHDDTTHFYSGKRDPRLDIRWDDVTTIVNDSIVEITLPSMGIDGREIWSGGKVMMKRGAQSRGGGAAAIFDRLEYHILAESIHTMGNLEIYVVGVLTK